MAALRRSWRSAAVQDNPPPAPPSGALTRRAFLGTSVLAAGSLLLPRKLARRQAPRIAVVGAGIAGLNAAHTLRKAGISASIYEAAPRVGGRIFTISDALAPGLTTELGGEFIDSTHEDLLGLVDELGLELIDRAELDRQGLLESYFFDGQHRTGAELVDALAALLEVIDADLARIDESEEDLIAFDQMSIAQYFDDRLGLTSGWLRELLDVAFVTENGLSIEEQSALNFLWLAPSVGEDGSVSMFGASDERYSVRGGNSLVTDGLAALLEGQIETGYRLEALTQQPGGSYTLSFQANGGARAVEADYVVLTIPFSVLRGIDLRVELPPLKRQAIDELGYGTNAKVLLGFTSRFWQDQGRTGEAFTDEAFQLSWDNSVLQDGEAGGMTWYSGGQGGLDVGTGSDEEQITRLMPGFTAAFPGAQDQYNGRALRMHWPTYDLALGSYSCPTVGQYTTFFAAIPEPVDGLYFAGEHCSDEFWGFMNGGAQSGRFAAEALVEAIG